MSHRISDQFSGWIESAIEKHGQGERLTWEMALHPHPNGMGVTIVLWMPGALINTVIHSMTTIGNPVAVDSAEAMETMMAEAIEALRQERSKQLGGPGIAQGVPGVNGGSPSSPTLG